MARSLWVAPTIQAGGWGIHGFNAWKTSGTNGQELGHTQDLPCMGKDGIDQIDLGNRFEKCKVL